MAGYVPHYRKKIDRLNRMEDDLRRLIDRGSSQEELLEAAIEVRDCRIRVLRAKQSQILQTGTQERRVFLKFEEKIEALLGVTAEEVLTEFLPSDERL